MRFAEAAAKPAETQARFSAEQTVAVLTPLFTARTQTPPLAEVYELIAEAWARSHGATEAEIEAARRCLRDAPARTARAGQWTVQ